jgi:mono/diheme cytochrome c family protein
MNNRFRSLWVLAVFAVIICAACFAQSSGEAIYKAKCQACHGADGAGDTVVGKVIGVKPLSDPEVKKYTVPDMIEIVSNGKNKMQSFKDKLTAAQIKASVEYFRTFIK